MTEEIKMEDENIKKAEQATKMAMLQNRAKEFQDKNRELQNKEYQGRVQGINISMRGDFVVNNVHIDQSFYETASKGQIEIAITKCLANLHTAVQNDIELLAKQFQDEIVRMQKDNGDGTY